MLRSIISSRHLSRATFRKTTYRTLTTWAAPPMSSSKQVKWPIRDEVPDLSGKVALVTGANSSGGMGFHTAYQLACKNAKVYVGARSTAKANLAIQEMRNENPDIRDGQLVPFIADLGDMQAVRDAVRKFLQVENRIDILIHNAAIISMPLDINSDGISVSFATKSPIAKSFTTVDALLTSTSHLGPFFLTTELLPLLKHTAENLDDVRVIVVSAASYKLIPQGTRFNSLSSFNAQMEPSALGGADFTRYSLSKLANLLFARQLQKNFDDAGIDAISISLHPGLIKTTGVMNSIDPDKQRSLEGRLSPLEGVSTALFAATSPKVWQEKDIYKGSYLIPPGAVEDPVGCGQDDELAKELWTTSEKVIQDISRALK